MPSSENIHPEKTYPLVTCTPTHTQELTDTPKESQTSNPEHIGSVISRVMKTIMMKEKIRK